MNNKKNKNIEMQNDDLVLDYSLRPKNWEAYFGQDAVKSNLKVFIQSSLQRKESLDHIIFYGPPGIGKTSLAYLVAQEMGVSIKVVQAPILKKTGDLASYLSRLERFSIFFIDEIHRLRTEIEEMLYTAMEEFKLDVILGEGPSAELIRIQIEPFTLIGATTKLGLLSSPFCSRFSILERLDYYKIDDLVQIILKSAKSLAIEVSRTSAAEIAKRSRGIPRIANRLLKRLRDFAQVENSKILDHKILQKGFDALNVDALGLDKMDRRLLTILAKDYKGGPVGIETLSISLGETVDTIEDTYEPFLIRIGFLERTSRGRLLTKMAYEYLGLENLYPSNNTSEKFNF